MTDNLPTLLSAPELLKLEGNGKVAYNATAHQVSWTGIPASGQRITMTFPLTVMASSPTTIRNTVVLTDTNGSVASDTVILIAQAKQVYLPLIRR